MREKLSAHGNRFGDIVAEIVISRQFLNKRVAPESETLAAQ
jgi:hypothetical protein